IDFDTASLLVAQAGFKTIAIDKIDKPVTKETDGPSGFNTNVLGGNNLKAVCYPSSTVLAQTWDWYMAYQVGVAIGIEANALGIEGWYGPGANLHRSPLGGRNFEYYSEDPQLAGIMCAYHVLGAKEKGVLAYIKHIGPNEQDYQSGIVNDIDEGIRCGNSQMLHPDAGLGLYDDRSSDTAKYYIHKSAKDILYAYAETKHFAETSQGLDKGSLIGTARDVFPWWVPVLIVIDVTAAGIMAFWLLIAWKPGILKRKKKAATADGQSLELN
ncbi:MAG: hypothetical protein OSJ83_10045, partial [Clostridia bacterium]|nr:hypothetical protein [Clostridia bacterium]